MKTKKNKTEASASRLLMNIFLVFLLPLVSLFLGLFIYVSNFNRNQIMAKCETHIESVCDNLEDELKRCENYLWHIVSNDVGFQSLQYQQDSLTLYLRLYELNEKISSILQTSGCLDAVYFISLVNGKYYTSRSERFSLDQDNRVSQYLSNLLENNMELLTNQWTFCKLENEIYFIRVMGKKNAYCVGVVNAENISESVNMEGYESFLGFCIENSFLSWEEEMETRNIVLHGDRDFWRCDSKWTVYRRAFSYLGCDVFLVEKADSMFFSHAFLLFSVTTVFVFAILLLYCSKKLKRVFLLPLSQMAETIDEIASGSLSVRMNANEYVKEYNIVEDAFNNLIDRISQLKILAYNRQIEVQQTMLQYYQIQIRPHFFLNCIKTIYAMLVSGKVEQAKEMILIMSDYLRAVFSDHEKLIPLDEELKNVKFYIKLQEMSGSVLPVYTLSVEDGLEKQKILPMSLLTFIENSFRYRKPNDKVFRISIQVKTIRDEKDSYLNITIKDSGVGFSNEALDRLNHFESFPEGRHIGIANVWRRMQLIYKENYEMVFSNMNGACVDIFLPMTVNDAESW